MMRVAEISHALRVALTLSVLLALAGCTFKPGYLKGKTTDVPNRWRVEDIVAPRLSDDQRQVFGRRGAPTYVRFFREVETRKPVYTWIYVGPAETVDLVWFVEGQRVDAIAVDSDPSAFSSTTRRRVRIALLSATGAAIVPVIVLLAN
jgi:hypothetical protein